MDGALGVRGARGVRAMPGLHGVHDSRAVQGGRTALLPSWAKRKGDQDLAKQTRAKVSFTVEQSPGEPISNLHIVVQRQ